MPSPTPKNLAQAYTQRSDIQDSDNFAGHRGTSAGAGSRWLWSTIKANLTAVFNGLYSQLGHTHATVSKVVTQPSHGFVAKQAVYDNNGTWALAKADALATCRGVGVVESVPNSNTFVVVLAGDLAVTGWAANTQYFLSATTAGLLTTTEPSSDEHFLLPVVRTGAAAVGRVVPAEPLSLSLIPDAALQNPRPASATQLEVEAGTEPGLRSYSPLRIKQAILALAPGGSGSIPTGLVALFPRAGMSSLPSGWIECDGANGTSDEADVGSMAVVIKHGGIVATPTFTPSAGSFGAAQSVAISSDTPGVTIRYTTGDGTQAAPTRTSGTVYSGPISVSATTTIKAIAYRVTAGDPTLTMVDSAVASAPFTITADTTAPTLVSSTILANGTTLRDVYSENMAVGGAGGSGRTLTPSGGAATVGSPIITGTQVDWTIGRTVYAGETATTSYTQPGTGLRDTASTPNYLASFSGVSVVNNSTQVAPSGATPPYTDTFNRANETPLAGDWETVGTWGGVNLSGNQATNATTGYCGARVKTSALTIGSNQLARVLIPSGSPDLIGPAVRVQASGACYYCRSNATYSAFEIIRRNADGSEDQIAVVLGYGLMYATERLCIKAVGQVISGFKKTADGAEYSLLSVTDSHPTLSLTGGQPGFFAHDSGAVETFEADNA